MTQQFQVNAMDAGLLFMFGALNLGLGMALFVTGARLLPSAIAALIGIAEPVLGPLWVWLMHNEIPSARTMLGGGIVFLALVAHIGWQLKQSREEPLVPTAD
jgi:drug/metabolite transporter (DMT)-like permease